MRVDLFLLIIVFVIIGCNNGKRAITELDDLRSYYENVLRQELNSQGAVVIIQNHRCVACNEGVLEEYFRELERIEAPMDFILSRYEWELDSIIQGIDRSRLFIDSLLLKTDYGLDFGAHLLFIINGTEGSERLEIKDDNIDKLAHIR